MVNINQILLDILSLQSLPGFGGKVEPGENVYQAALRELEVNRWETVAAKVIGLIRTQEEAMIRAKSLTKIGISVSVFENNPKAFEVHVFLATEFEGEPTE